MRCLVLSAAAIVVACGSPPTPYEGPVFEPGSESDPVPDARIAPQVRSSLCFTVQEELRDLLPGIETLALIAGDWWSWPVVFTGDCESELVLGDVFDETGRRRPAGHRARLLDDGTELTGAFVGGRSVITFDREALLTERVVDTTPSGCRASAPQEFVLAHVVLAHEMGHVLRVEHCQDCDGALMAEALEPCAEPMPTLEDLTKSALATE